VEVEIIGLPVDCCKEQTRVVDDNGERAITHDRFYIIHTNNTVHLTFNCWGIGQ